MSTSNNLIQNMKNHANAVNLPKLHKDDLKLDFNIIRKYGNCRYIWLLRESGTAIVPLKRGINPLHILNYIDDENARCFLINGFEETTFKSLKKDKVDAMLHELPIDFSTITDSQQLIDQLMKLLDDDNVRQCAFHVAEKCSGPSGWEKLQRFYESGKNAVMELTMKKARNKLVTLSRERVYGV